MKSFLISIDNECSNYMIENRVFFFLNLKEDTILRVPSLQINYDSVCEECKIGGEIDSMC